MPRDAVVIGGGVIGHTSALALLRAGYAVTLFDPMREPCGASWGNAGHIAIEQPEPWASWPSIRSAPGRLFARGGALDFRLRDIDRWLPFSLRLMVAASPASFARGKAALASLLAQTDGAWKRLAADLGDPGLYRQSGQFLVWESAATAAGGMAHWRKADLGTASFRGATPEELARLAALMKKPPAGAIRFSGTGQISDPTLLAAALARTFEARGGNRRYERANRIEIANGRTDVLLDGGERIAADIVLVAAGVRSGEVLRGTGLSVPLIAERGYHIQAETQTWPHDLGPIIFEDRSLIVTRFASSVRAASFLEFGRPDTPPDPRKWEKLRFHMRDLGLPFDLPGKHWMGSRPTLPDYLPAIGRSTRAPNLLYAFGHQHLGLTLSAITGEIVGALASGAPPPVPVAPFRIERFG